MKFILLSVMAALFVVGCGSNTSDGGNRYSYLFNAKGNPTPDRIQGIWSMQEQSDTGTVDGRIQFTATTMTIANRCTFPDNSVLTVGASTSIELDEENRIINIQQAVKDEIKSGNNICLVNLPQVRAQYFVVGTTLIFGNNEMTKVSDN